MRTFQPQALSGVVVVCGHYGVGKTAFSLALAGDAARAGRAVTLVDLDVVNPYFRSSDQRQALEDAGVSVVSPVYAGPSCNIDMPALTGAVEPAIERARADARRIVVIDVGGDDAGASALGRFAGAIAQGSYQMLYVVNRFRALTQAPREAIGVLRDIEGACRLRATGIVDNSHLMGDTTAGSIEEGARFACEVAREAGLPLVAHVVAKRFADAGACALARVNDGACLYAIEPYRQTTWGNE